MGGYINSTGGSGSAISIAGNLTSNGYNTVYFGKNVTNTKTNLFNNTIVPGVIYVVGDIISNSSGVIIGGNVSSDNNGTLKKDIYGILVEGNVSSISKEPSYTSIGIAVFGNIDSNKDIGINITGDVNGRVNIGGDVSGYINVGD